MPTLDKQIKRVRRFFSGSRDRPILERSRLKVPRTRFNGAITGRRSAAFARVPLARAKELRKQLGVTINDVVLAVCAGTLRRYLVAHEELPKKPLLAVCPISVRDQAGAVAGSTGELDARIKAALQELARSR